jgi:hypothetical protein
MFFKPPEFIGKLKYSIFDSSFSGCYIALLVKYSEYVLENLLCEDVLSPQELMVISL